MVDAMDGQLKACVVGSHNPTQSALSGANTTTPLPAVAAPRNFPSMLMVDAIDGQLKVCVAGSNNPTQSALNGASTTTPLPAVAAPINFQVPLTVDAIDELQLNVPPEL